MYIKYFFWTIHLYMLQTSVLSLCFVSFLDYSYMQEVNSIHTVCLCGYF